MVRSLRINSTLSSLRLVENAVDEITSDAGISFNNYGKILVSVLEAVNNAIIHGNKSIPEKFVEVKMNYNKGKLKVIVKDQGKGFIPENIPDPTTPENIEEANGRGVFIMSKLADEIKFSKKGNSVTMIFKNVND